MSGCLAQSFRSLWAHVSYNIQLPTPESPLVPWWAHVRYNIQLPVPEFPSVGTRQIQFPAADPGASIAPHASGTIPSCHLQCIPECAHVRYNIRLRPVDKPAADPGDSLCGHTSDTIPSCQSQIFHQWAHIRHSIQLPTPESPSVCTHQIPYPAANPRVPQWAYVKKNIQLPLQSLPQYTRVRCNIYLVANSSAPLSGHMLFTISSCQPQSLPQWTHVRCNTLLPA